MSKIQELVEDAVIALIATILLAGRYTQHTEAVTEARALWLEVKRRRQLSKGA